MSDGREQPLLLHSMAEFRPLVVPILDAVAPERIVEIGGEGGLMTETLLDWADAHGAAVQTVDPHPSPELEALGRAGRTTLVRAKSPGALADLAPAGLYVIDGDHNHHVVSGELRAVFGEDPAPVALMHDVAWPAARRDMYYDPSDVPSDARHPYDYDAGAVLGEPQLQPGQGFWGVGSFAYASHEGGPRNGVLTAVDDLLAGRDDLEFRRVPAVFGLGVLFAREAPAADALRAILDPFHENPLLARLEENRLRLYLEVIDRREAVAAAERGQRDLVAGLERELEAAQAELARLRLELAGRG